MGYSSRVHVSKLAELDYELTPTKHTYTLSTRTFTGKVQFAVYGLESERTYTLVHKGERHDAKSSKSGVFSWEALIPEKELTFELLL